MRISGSSAASDVSDEPTPGVLAGLALPAVPAANADTASSASSLSPKTSPTTPRRSTADVLASIGSSTGQMLSSAVAWTGMFGRRNRSTSVCEPRFTTNPYSVFSDRVVIAMVGLPARGKSYISKAMVRYLNFMGIPARLFNAGAKRRVEGNAGVDAKFFDASNQDAAAQRERMAMETLDELLEWLQSETTPTAGCACGIFDATNTTKARREKVRQRIAQEQPTVRLVFVESICNDEVTLENNYRMKLSNDDYKGTDPKKAMADFMERVKQYEARYEPVDDMSECRDFAPSEMDDADDDELPPPPGCLKLIDAGRKLVTNSLSGPVSEHVLNLLHSIHLGPRCIWITLVGETANDLRGILGGDSGLSPEGRKYAEAVRAHVLAREASSELMVGGARPPPAMVLTGTLRRYAEMAEIICQPEPSDSARSSPSEERSSASSDGGDGDGGGGGDGGGERQRQRQRQQQEKRRMALQLQRLNELCAGKLDSLSYDQMRDGYPREYAARAADKLNYRYPGAGGESYMDLIMRLDSAILMLEQSRGNALVVCDRAVCRVLLGYFDKFGGAPNLASLPSTEVPAGVIELRRSHSGFAVTHTLIDSGATTRVAGPGTVASPWQAANKLSSRRSSSAAAGLVPPPLAQSRSTEN